VNDAKPLPLAGFVVSVQLQAKSYPNSFAQAICRKWLKQERGATKIHGPLPVLFILGLGYEYDGQFEAHRSKADSQIHARNVAKVDIDHNACGFGRCSRAEEFLGRCIQLCKISPR